MTTITTNNGVMTVVSDGMTNTYVQPVAAVHIEFSNKALTIWNSQRMRVLLTALIADGIIINGEAVTSENVADLIVSSFNPGGGSNMPVSVVSPEYIKDIMSADTAPDGYVAIFGALIMADEAVIDFTTYVPTTAGTYYVRTSDGWSGAPAVHTWDASKDIAGEPDGINYRWCIMYRQGVGRQVITLGNKGATMITTFVIAANCDMGTVQFSETAYQRSTLMFISCEAGATANGINLGYCYLLRGIDEIPFTTNNSAAWNLNLSGIPSSGVRYVKIPQNIVGSTSNIIIPGLVVDIPINYVSVSINIGGNDTLRINIQNGWQPTRNLAMNYAYSLTQSSIVDMANNVGMAVNSGINFIFPSATFNNIPANVISIFTQKGYGVASA